MCQGSELITLTYCPILLRAEGHGCFFVCLFFNSWGERLCDRSYAQEEDKILSLSSEGRKICE